MPTGREYAKKVLEVYNMNPKAGYIWGTAGRLWTAGDQKALEEKYRRDPVKYADLKIGAEYGSKWINHRVWDCSGLTSERARQLGLSYHHGSNSSYNGDCEYKGVKTKDMKLPIGAWVYTGSKNNHPHIGVVVDDEWVVEAQGTKAGVVKTKISLAKWTYWGLGKGMEFDFVPGMSGNPTKKEPVSPTVPAESLKPAVQEKKRPTIRRGDRGEYVKELQTILRKTGSNLAVDGIFGIGTQSAVRTFQKKHGLVVDGIVGPKTWAELLKV